MDVDDFGAGFILRVDCMSSESKELDKVFWGNSEILNSLKKTSYGSILPVHDHSEKGAVVWFEIACKCG